MGEESMIELPSQITIGEKYGPAMKVKTKAEARLYFEACVRHNMAAGNHTREEAERVEMANIGYYAGYYDSETMERVNRLFGTTHPVFGSVRPTAEQAIQKGRETARK
jgi:hypothetical protein